jgi:hypothetical protein
MSVVSMVTGSPTNKAGFVIRYLIGLTLQTGLIDTVLADGAVLYCNVPTPKCYRIPLFNFNTLIDLHLI